MRMIGWLKNKTGIRIIGRKLTAEFSFFEMAEIHNPIHAPVILTNANAMKISVVKASITESCVADSTWNCGMA